MTEHTVDVTIAHPMGIHLRIGKDVVSVVNQFDAEITAQNLTRNSPVADLRSILQIMQLQARQGHRLRLNATGQDAYAAIAALTTLFQSLS